MKRKKGSFLNKEWGMNYHYHQASARFLLDRTPLIDRRRSHPVVNSDDADVERSGGRDHEFAAEQAAGDAAVGVVVDGGGPSPRFLPLSFRVQKRSSYRSEGGEQYVGVTEIP